MLMVTKIPIARRVVYFICANVLFKVWISVDKFRYVLVQEGYGAARFISIREHVYNKLGYKFKQCLTLARYCQYVWMLA